MQQVTITLNSVQKILRNFPIVYMISKNIVN